ncbi:hypothetical protein NVP1193O_037 [Vibrio phage 1.193.O._10N.286.52.C6]|nr:hypothetical protein NVP1193O_037 [Vibrio phage 1.193.O._10N.286.52.C6]
MGKTKTLTDILSRHLGVEEKCHGFEIQERLVELWLCMQGYKYYEKYISIESFHEAMEEYFNND